MTSSPPLPLLILGAGYTGEAVVAAAAGTDLSPVPTSRTPAGRITPSGAPYVGFDLRDPQSWTTLPTTAHVAWLFPAEPLDLVAAFARDIGLTSRRVVVVGTTSSYLHDQDGAAVDEDAALDLKAERVKGEEYLRSIGATVLRASGIYGPALGTHPPRNPLSWLRRGMISSPDSLVNLVHISDLAAAILEALKRDVRGEQLIVSDGTPRRWGDIGDWAVRSGLMADVRYSGAGRKLSKRLSSAKLTSRLGQVISHPDLYAELGVLEGRQPGPAASPAR